LSSFLSLSVIKPPQKKRPAVIISSARYNAASQDIIIMAVTSRLEKVFDIGECIIQNWKEAGLLKPSSIKPALSTIEQKLATFRKCVNGRGLDSITPHMPGVKGRIL